MQKNKAKIHTPDLDLLIKKAKPKKQKEGNANRIAEILIEKAMTQQELADLTGLYNSHISEIVSGNRKGVSLNVAIKIAKALEMPIEDIFSNYPQSK